MGIDSNMANPAHSTMKARRYDKKTVDAPARPARSSKIMLISLPLIILGVPALMLHFSSIRNQSASVSGTVEKWRPLYHLNDAQAASIQQIELDFHGTGSPFSIRNRPTEEQKLRHHEHLSRQMSPSDGKRFIEMMEKGGSKH